MLLLTWTFSSALSILLLSDASVSEQAPPPGRDEGESPPHSDAMVKVKVWSKQRTGCIESQRIKNRDRSSRQITPVRSVLVLAGESGGRQSAHKALQQIATQDVM